MAPHDEHAAHSSVESPPRPRPHHPHPDHRRGRRRHRPGDPARHPRDPGRGRGSARLPRDHGRRAGLPAGHHQRRTGRRLAEPAAHRRAAEGTDHDAQGQRLEERQRHVAQDPRPVRQRATLCQLHPVRARSGRHGRGRGPRKRGGPLRRHRAPPDPGRLPVPEDRQSQRLRAHRSLRVRLRARPRPQEGDVDRQGQHHEADRRPVRAGLRAGRRRVPGAAPRAPDRRHRHRANRVAAARLTTWS